MKKGPLLNQPLSAVIAGMAHHDLLVIADAGTPIPKETTRIDLAVCPGTPSLIEVLETVLAELEVEAALLETETDEVSPEMAKQLTEVLNRHKIPIEKISHEETKQICHTAAAVVRTGECTPYANLVLRAGVIF